MFPLNWLSTRAPTTDSRPTPTAKPRWRGIWRGSRNTWARVGDRPPRSRPPDHVTLSGGESNDLPIHVTLSEGESNDLPIHVTLSEGVRDRVEGSPERTMWSFARGALPNLRGSFDSLADSLACSECHWGSGASPAQSTSASLWRVRAPQTRITALEAIGEDCIVAGEDIPRRVSVATRNKVGGRCVEDGGPGVGD